MSGEREMFDDEKWIGMRLTHQSLHEWARALGDIPVESVLGAVALFVAEVHLADSDSDLDGWIGLLRKFSGIRAAQMADVGHA